MSEDVEPTGKKAFKVLRRYFYTTRIIITLELPKNLYMLKKKKITKIKPNKKLLLT